MFFITLLDQIYWVASAAMGAGLGAGGQEDLDRGVGQHNGADVAAIHQDVLAFGQAALGVQQEAAHRGVCGHGGRSHADVLGTDGRADVLAV